MSKGESEDAFCLPEITKEYNGSQDEAAHSARDHQSNVVDLPINVD